MNSITETNLINEAPVPIIFTDSAASKVKTLIEEEGNNDLKLRVFVSGGGCSGFKYGFTFDEMIKEMVNHDMKLANIEKNSDKSFSYFKK